MAECDSPACSALAEAQLAAALENSRDAAFHVADHGFLHVCGAPRYGRLLFAHGAGAGMESRFMRQFVASLASQGIQVLGVEFAYMQQMRESGRRRPPPAINVLVEEFARWQTLIQSAVPAPLWLGGKSLGGRAASMLAARVPVDGLVIAGYPFHPPRSPDRLRLAHWPRVTCPALILQGERDAFGSRSEVAGYTLPSNVSLAWLTDGGHDLVPRRRSGESQQNLIDEAARLGAVFIRADGRSRQASSPRGRKCKKRGSAV